MTDQPTPTPGDDPIVRAGREIWKQVKFGQWGADDVIYAVRVATDPINNVPHSAPLIARVRELLGEIHGGNFYDGSLMQAIADAVEVVRKERERDGMNRWHYEDLQRQLAAANAEKRIAVDLLRLATNTKYPNAPQELHALAKIAADMLKVAHDGLHDADAVHRDLRGQLAAAKVDLETEYAARGQDIKHLNDRIDAMGRRLAVANASRDDWKRVAQHKDDCLADVYAENERLLKELGERSDTVNSLSRQRTEWIIERMRLERQIAELDAWLRGELTDVHAMVDKLRSLTDAQILRIAKRVFHFLDATGDPDVLTQTAKRCGTYVIERIIEAINAVVGFDTLNGELQCRPEQSGEASALPATQGTSVPLAMPYPKGQPRTDEASRPLSPKPPDQERVEPAVALTTSSLDQLRSEIEDRYAHVRLGSGTVGGSFGEILCSELHDGHGLHFAALAEKWRIDLPTLGDLIADHCRKLPPATQPSEPEGGDAQWKGTDRPATSHVSDSTGLDIPSSSPQATAPTPSADEYYRLKILKNGLTLLKEQRGREGAELATIDDMIREADVLIGRNRCYPAGDKHSEKCDGRCGKAGSVRESDGAHCVQDKDQRWVWSKR